MGKVISVLFFGMFAAAGTLAFIHLGWSQISGSIEAKSWQPVQARLLSYDLDVRHGDDSTTYKAIAKYEYDYLGQRYTSNKIGFTKGADNFGSYHQDMHQRLVAVDRQGLLLTAWVDPEDPSQAVIDRGLRWSSLLFASFFLFVFGGVGYGGVYFVMRTRNLGEPLPDADPSRPWTRYQEWNDPTILSNAKLGGRVMLGVAVFWNAVSLPATFLALRESFDGNYVALAALIFPAIGAWLFWKWYQMRHSYQLTGPMPLTLNPYPGSLGGQLGGTVRLSKPIRDLSNVSITASCIRTYVSGSGEDRKTRENVLWQNSMVPALSITANGPEFSFSFDLDRDLPVSGPPLDTPRKTWRVSFNATAPDGTIIERDYEDVPVFATAKRSSLGNRNAYAATSAATVKAQQQQLESILDLQQSDRGQQLIYPAFRHKWGIALFLFGMVFVVTGLAIPDLIFNIVFPLMGGIAALIGVYSFFNALEVRLGAEGITSQRSIMGYRLKAKFIPSYDLKKFKKEVSSSTNSGSKSTEYYRIIAHGRNGVKATVAESLKGSQAADAAIKKLHQVTGLVEAPSGGLTKSLDGVPLPNLVAKKFEGGGWRALKKSKRLGLHFGSVESVASLDFKLVSPFKRSIPALLIIGIVAAVLTAIEVDAISDAVSAWSKSDSGFGLFGAFFQTFWLLGWSFGVLLVLAIFALMAFGSQVLFVHDGKLDFILGIPMIGVRVSIKASEVSEVSLVESDSSTLFGGEGLQIQIETFGGESNTPFGSNQTQEDLTRLKQAIELNRGIEVDLGTVEGEDNQLN